MIRNPEDEKEILTSNTCMSIIYDKYICRDIAYNFFFLGYNITVQNVLIYPDRLSVTYLCRFHFQGPAGETVPKALAEHESEGISNTKL
jgi:hypothetical protein